VGECVVDAEYDRRIVASRSVRIQWSPRHLSVSACRAASEVVPIPQPGYSRGLSAPRSLSASEPIPSSGGSFACGVLAGVVICDGSDAGRASSVPRHRARQTVRERPVDDARPKGRAYARRFTPR
jgi:hypothetical protein